ncbi:hypothetical protein EMCRGX_G024349 [Ephydatia muelleri]
MMACLQVRGLHINLPKCEMFSKSGNSHFPDTVKSSILPNLEILGSPIGDFIYCSQFLAEKCSLQGALLTDVSAVDLHVAISLLHMCGGYCKLVHPARTTPTSLCSDSLKFFDEEVRLCFASCLAVDVPDTQWHQAQLCPKLAASDLGSPDNIHLQQAVSHFNAQVSPQDSLTVEASTKLACCQFLPPCKLLGLCHPLCKLDMHLDSEECQVSIRWWLGLNTSTASSCPFCPGAVLDPLGHHATSCWHGGDVVTRHNHLRDTFAEFCHRAHLSVRVSEVGYGLSGDHINTRPANVLVQGWDRGKPAAFDITVTSPHAAECREHSTNDARCQELGWVCIPLAVETFGHWGKEAQNVFSRLASLLSIHQGRPKSVALFDIYSRMNMCLVRSVSRAIVGRVVVL